MRTAKTLIRLGGCPVRSDSSLGEHSRCWFCHEAAQIFIHRNFIACADEYKNVNSFALSIQKIDKAVEKLNRGAGGLKKLTNEANETIDGKSRDGETVLHRAIARLTFKSDDAYEMKVIRLLVDRFPELAAERRPNSDKFRGQTPVHMAVTKGVHKVVDILLTKLSPDTQVLKELETERSVGSVFRNTVMMAELPLSVAALKNDRKMFQQLLQYGEHGAALDARNSKGDNVCHSLIKLVC